MEKEAEVKITATPGPLATGLRAASKMLQVFAQNSRETLARMQLAPAKAKTGGWLSTAVGEMVGGLATRGVDVVLEQGKAWYQFEKDLTRFGISANQTPAQMEAIGRAAREMSSQLGLPAGEVLGAAKAFVDLAGAENFSIDKMRLLTESAQASGARTKDLAGMMYQLTRSMKVADDQMNDTMGGLINQAKDGAIEAAQMSQEFAGMMPIFARFGVVGREGAVQLGAMYQVTRDGFDSAATAATGMIRILAGVQRNASKLAKFGIQVFKPGSKRDLREFSDIMAQIHKSPISKDIEKLIKGFGRSEAWRTWELLDESPERLRKLEEAGRVNGVIAKDLATYMASTAGKTEQAMERIKNAVAAAMSPERVELFLQALDGMADRMPALIKLTGTLADGWTRIMDFGSNFRKTVLHEPDKDYQNPYGRSNALQALNAARLIDKDKYDIAADRPGPAKQGLMVGFKVLDKIAKQDEENARMYEVRARELDRLGPGEKPTDASIRKALELVNDPAEVEGGKKASERYLDHVPMDQQQRVRAKMIGDEVGVHLKNLGEVIVQAMDKSHFWGRDMLQEQAIAHMNAREPGKNYRMEAGKLVWDIVKNSPEPRRKP